MQTPDEMQLEIARLLAIRAQASADLAYARATGAFSGLEGSLHKHKTLYFVLCGDTVKVGVSSDPEGRLESLQTGAPGKLTLLAMIPKAGHREKECHRRLEHLYLYGEWFRHTSEVDALIEELTQKE